MAKDPAFLFYSADFLAGVQDLTMEERGIYITLLSLQHQKGRLTDKLIRLALGISAAEYAAACATGDAAACAMEYAGLRAVIQKFNRDEEGRYFNARLEEEVEKRERRLDADAEKREKSAEKQRQRAFARWRTAENRNPDDAAVHRDDAAAYTAAHAAAYANNDAAAYAGGMPFYIENENENKDENGLSKKEPRAKKNETADPPNDVETGGTIEFLAITTGTRITAEEVARYWKAFAIHAGGSFHLGRADTLQHFRNWLKIHLTTSKNQNRKNGKTPERTPAGAPGAILERP